VQLGGNIGTAVLSLDEPAKNKVYVVECSSYQIDLAPSLDPSVGILLNLAPDHLDRHGTMAHYAEIKSRLVAKSDLAVIGADDAYCRQIGKDLEKQNVKVVTISSEHSLKNGIFLRGSNLVDANNGVETVLCDMDDAAVLRGAHNAQNAAAAWAACAASGLTSEEIRTGFATFPGLAHRLEQLGKVGQVLYVNDSKGTNADATARALSSFNRIYWIAGGLAKEGGITSLKPYFPKIAKAYLVGEAAPEFAATLGSDVPFEISGTVANAVASATADAANDNSEEPVVLLSPACASFDQFPNFEVRGDHFRSCVKALNGFTSLKEIMA
jgi:UDP-N-acetylmuramoylalanine--D-glutamate ligase